MGESPSFVEMKRSLSLASLDEATKIKEIVQEDLTEPPGKLNITKIVYLVVTEINSLHLPSFDNCLTDFRRFTCDHLLDMPMMKELESEKVLNWCVSLKIMVPLQTKGDGNCLFHAALLAMVGVHDRYHTLRKAVHRVLSQDKGDYRIRWQGEEEVLRSREGLRCDDEDMDREWNKLIQVVSEEEYPNGPGALQFGGSEGIHVFALANVLRRPIIVGCASTFFGWGGQVVSPVHVGGVYLPLEWDPADCVRTPLFLGYANSHFTAIVVIVEGNLDIPERANMPTINPHAIPGVPLVNADGSPLKVHFLRGRHQRQNQESLLRQYMDCVSIPRHSGDAEDILVARCNYEMHIPEVTTMMANFFQALEQKYQAQQRERAQLQTQHYNASTPDQLVPCSTTGCPNSALLSTDKKCNECMSKLMHAATLTQASNPPYNPQYIAKAGQSGAGNDPQPMEVEPSTSTVERRRCPTLGCKYYIASIGDQFCERCKQSRQEAIQCATPGCAFNATQENQNLCSRCKGEVVPTLPPPISVLPTNMCSPQCKRMGIVDLFGKCPDCYQKAVKTNLSTERTTTHIGASNVPPAPQPPPAEQPPKSPKSPLRVNIPPRGEAPSATSPVTAAPYCSTPDCQNLKTRGTLCEDCFLQHQGLQAFQIQQLQEPVTIMSGHGSVVIECIIKGCTKPGLPQFKGLCEDHNKSIRSESSPPSGEEVEEFHCVYDGCDFYATAETNYLCSQHFVQAQGQAQGQAQSQQRSEPFHAYPPLNQMVDETPCAIAGCYRRGRDDKNGLCMECYEAGFRMELQRISPVPRQDVQEPDASGCLSPSSSKRSSPRVLLPCVTSGCPSLVEPTDPPGSGLCLKCQGEGDVIKRGNKPSEPIYKYLEQDVRHPRGAEPRPLNQYPQPQQHRPHVHAQQPNGIILPPLNNPGSQQVNQLLYPGQ